MRALVVGFGSVGRRHFANLVHAGHDVALVSTGRGTVVHDYGPQVRVYPTLTDALGEASFDGVVVATPTAFHVEQAITALEHGCHVLVEKPLAASLDGIDELRRAESASAGQVLVGFQFRFNPALRRAATLLVERVLGEPLTVRVVWGEHLGDWHPWENYQQSYAARRELGGGVVHTLSHPLDYLRWLVGEVTAVTAEVGTSGVLAVDVDDYADILLRHGDVAAEVHLNFLQRPAVHELVVVLSEGTIVANCRTSAIRWYESSTGRWYEENVPSYVRNDDFMSEIEHFERVVRGVEPPLVTLADGVRAVEVANAAMEASRLGRRQTLQTSDV